MENDNQQPEEPITSIEYLLNGPALDNLRAQPGGYWTVTGNTPETFTLSYHYFAPGTNTLLEVSDHEFRPLRTLGEINQHANSAVYQYNADMYLTPECAHGVSHAEAANYQVMNPAHIPSIQHDIPQGGQGYMVMQGSNGTQTQVPYALGSFAIGNPPPMDQMMQYQNFRTTTQNGNEEYSGTSQMAGGNLSFLPQVSSSQNNPPFGQQSMGTQAFMTPTNFPAAAAQPTMMTNRGLNNTTAPPPGWFSWQRDWPQLPSEEAEQIQQRVMSGQMAFQ